MLGEGVADAFFVAALAVVIGLIDPSDDALFIDQDGSGDGHGFVAAWDSQRDPEEIPGLKFERFVVLETKSPDHLHLFVGEQGDVREAITCRVGFGLGWRVLAQGKDAHASLGKQRMHLVEPLQLSGAIGSPVAPKELEEDPLTLPVL